MTKGISADAQERHVKQDQRCWTQEGFFNRILGAAACWPARSRRRFKAGNNDSVFGEPYVLLHGLWEKKRL